MMVSSLHLIFWFLITVVTIIFWQPITALFKVNVFSLDSTTNALSIWFYRDGKYATSSGNKRVEARIRKRQSDLTASRGELIEVNVESAFEPIIQV